MKPNAPVPTSLPEPHCPIPTAHPVKFFLPLILACLVVLGACSSHQDDAPQTPPTKDSATSRADSARKPSKLNADGIDTTTFSITDSTVTLRQQAFPQPAGRVVNVMVTGLDSRLGDPMGHADANHLLRFFLDSGMVEIISIPRDTYYDAGFDDTTGLNKLTNVRANRGRNTYLKAVAEITGVGKIDHYVEFGFSQAIGLLELMGYKDNAASTLRVLRSRQAYRSGDFQRSYNQGQFIRQILMRHFDKTDGLLGDLALRAALALVDTDLSYDKCSSMMEALRASGFGNVPERSWVRLKPSVIASFKVYDFTVDNVNSINKEIDHKIHRMGLDSVPINEETYERRFSRLVDRAAADSAKSPASVIRLLRRPYEQRSWLQVSDKARRRTYRDRVCGLLISAYGRTKQQPKADAIRSFIDIDNSAQAGQ